MTIRGVYFTAEISHALWMDLLHRYIFKETLMKKTFLLILTLFAAESLFAGAPQEEMKSAAPVATDKLVVYSPNSDGLLNATIPAFEAKYGVKVEVISAGTGEWSSRGCKARPMRRTRMSCSAAPSLLT